MIRSIAPLSSIGTSSSFENNRIDRLRFALTSKVDLPSTANDFVKPPREDRSAPESTPVQGFGLHDSRRFRNQATTTIGSHRNHQKPRTLGESMSSSSTTRQAAKQPFFKSLLQANGSPGSEMPSLTLCRIRNQGKPLRGDIRWAKKEHIPIIKTASIREVTLPVCQTWMPYHISYKRAAANKQQYKY